MGSNPTSAPSWHRTPQISRIRESEAFQQGRSLSLAHEALRSLPGTSLENSSEGPYVHPLSELQNVHHPNPDRNVSSLVGGEAIFQIVPRVAEYR